MAHQPVIQQATVKIRTMPLFCLIPIVIRTLASAALMLALMTGPANAQPPEQHAAIRLVAHPTVATSWLNRDTTRAIFAMRQRTWPDGEAVQVFVLPNRDPVHARFAKERLAVYPHQLQLAWDRMVFSGMGQAPNRVSNQLEMREKVANTPGALGYLEREYLDESVHVISME
ncbi:hypothetical protein [Vreelandella zhaodongensis]|uniref:hypothetical protein n=1 Tax=Vreelandella zhaodongensis TaxID=1176240 RepID=UPI003EBB3EF9